MNTIFFQTIDKPRTHAEGRIRKEIIRAQIFSRGRESIHRNPANRRRNSKTFCKTSPRARLGNFVKIDYRVIRGLAYYTGIVFEAFDAKGEFRAIAGGGRYDNLVKLISGGKVRSCPSLASSGMGDVVLLEILKARGLLPKFDTANVDVFVLIEDETLRRASR